VILFVNFNITLSAQDIDPSIWGWAAAPSVRHIDAGRLDFEGLPRKVRGREIRKWKRITSRKA
jgi:hypothetical protein